MNNTFLAQDPMALGTKLNGSPGSVGISDEWGNMKMARIHGRYRDVVHNKHVFYASNQAGVGGQVTTVWAATTFTGLYLYNPVNSGYAISLLAVASSVMVFGATIKATCIGQFQGAPTENHTITPVCTKLDSANASIMHAGYDATLAVAPTMIFPLDGGVLASTAPYTSGVRETSGMFEALPGAGFCTMTLVATTGWWAFLWEEIPL